MPKTYTENRRRAWRREALLNQRTTHLLEPPAEEITPEIAARWLRGSYGPLESFSRASWFPQEIIRRKRDMEATVAMRTLGRDLSKIVEACGVALSTKRPVPMRFSTERCSSRLMQRSLRAALRFERRECERWHRKRPELPWAYQYAGVRPKLERALRAWEYASSASEVAS